METTMIQSIPELGRTAAQVIPPHWYVVLASILFGIGVLGVLFRKNAIIILMSIEFMLNAVNLLMVAFSSYHNDPNGQVFVFFIMAVAAAEVAVGLAILMMIYRNTKTTDIDFLSKLKG
jgi:NADH-quinone oxidoreductase subunit K